MPKDPRQSGREEISIELLAHVRCDASQFQHLARRTRSSNDLPRVSVNGSCASAKVDKGASRLSWFPQEVSLDNENAIEGTLFSDSLQSLRSKISEPACCEGIFFALLGV